MATVKPAPERPSSLADLPTTPAIYALYGGRGTHAYVAYVGAARSLKDPGSISTSCDEIAAWPPIRRRRT